MKTVLFWDIDGTLLTTRRAGIGAWEAAVEAVIGRPVDLTEYPTAGGTDHAIAVRIMKDYTGIADESKAETMTRIYEDGLPKHLPTREGRVLPGVKAILDACMEREDVVCHLLTGNTPKGAKAKLEHYGLAQYFVDGAFSERAADDRNAIARRAFAQITVRLGGVPERDEVFVIGDTPHDISCGRAIGARTIAVATGVHTLADLQTHEPWWAVEQLPDPKSFFHKLDV